MLAHRQLFNYERASMIYKKDKKGNRVVFAHNERVEAERGAREAGNTGVIDFRADRPIMSRQFLSNCAHNGAITLA